MKVFYFVLLAAANANEYSYIYSYALRKKGVLLEDVDSTIKIGTPPATYSKVYSDDKLATKRVQQLVTILKRMFHVGIDPLPILDPFKRSVLGPFNVNNKLVKGKVTLRNVVISGAKSVNVKDLLMRLHYDDQFRLDLNATIPSLTFAADLETNVKVKKNIPIKVKGGISIVMKNLKINGGVGGRPVVLKGGRSVMNVNAIHGYGTAKSAMVNLKFSSSILKLIQGKGLGINLIFKAGKDEIGEAIGETVIKEVNDVLNKISLEQVQAFLVGDD